MGRPLKDITTMDLLIGNNGTDGKPTPSESHPKGSSSGTLFLVH